MDRAAIDAISPFFIVANVDRTIQFYRDRLGFELMVSEPAQDPFFAILFRGGAMLFVKSEAGLASLPNPERHPHMSWDAYVSVPDPDALAAEFADTGVTFHRPLEDTHDGLRGFEVRDPDGYVLFFGRPR